MTRYQLIVNDGFALSDEHCLKVNPLIIERKNRSSDLVNSIRALSSAETVQKTLESYINSANKYVDAEQDWLGKQEKFLNRWDFKVLAPTQVKKSADLQYKIRVREVFGALILTDVYENRDRSTTEEEKKQASIRNTRKIQELQAEYDKLFLKKASFPDPRFYLIKAPRSKCPPENFKFPVVPDPLAPETPEVPNTIPFNHNIFSLS